MDVLARLYQILKARSASICARRETPHGEEGHENVRREVEAEGRATLLYAERLQEAGRVQ